MPSMSTSRVSVQNIATWYLNKLRVRVRPINLRQYIAPSGKYLYEINYVLKSGQ